jgi:hypothetical protein
MEQRAITHHRPLPSEMPDVAIVDWPMEDERRRQLAVLGQPRLLLVPSGVEPPELLDDLEDWIRSPADPIDLMARSKHLRIRASQLEAPAPVLDDDGLLWVGDAWVAITDAQLPVVRLLLEHADRVVRLDALVAAYVSGGGSDHPASVRTLMSRLGGRLAPLGLELVTVRRRGMLLRTGASRLRP